MPLLSRCQAFRFATMRAGVVAARDEGCTLERISLDEVAEGRIPIPATSIAIGQPGGSEAYIGISVGRAELVFSLPASSLVPVGQSLMLAGTSSNAAAS